MQPVDTQQTKLWTRNFILMIVLNTFIFFGFQMLMPTLPGFIKQMGVTDSTVGLVTGIFTISTLIVRPFAGLALDRIGRKPVLIAGLTIFIIMVSSYSFLPSIGLILFFRFIHGFGWGTTTTSTSTIAAECPPRKRFAEGMGYFGLSSSLAMALAPGFGLAFVALYNFRSLTFLSAALVATGLLLTFLLKYDKTVCKTETNGKRKFYERSAMRPALLTFLVNIPYGSVTSFIALYAAQRGIANIGAFFTVYALIMLISRPLFGKLIDKFGFNFTIIPGLMMITTTMLLLSRSTTLPLFLVAAFFYGMGNGAVQPTLQTMAVRDVPKERLGAANATFFTGFDAGLGFGAIIFGRIATAVGYSNMYMFASIPIILALILYFAIARKQKQKRNA